MPQHVLNTPSIRIDVLGVVDLPAGEEREVRFEAMVPGLTSIPQALYFEVL